MPQIAIIDAFTDHPFAGNPAAVCWLGKERLPEPLMQKVAAEMNLSETAFLTQTDVGFAIRWFTPAEEVSLCGHATLASAHYLWEENIVATDQSIRFHSAGGVLGAEFRGGDIALDFPKIGMKTAAVEDRDLSALGLDRSEVVDVKTGGGFCLIEIDQADRVPELSPDFPGLRQGSHREYLVTAAPFDTWDFVSRFFAPAIGINEDPVTGSAHCLLTPYWAEKTGRRDFRAYQASPRGGSMSCRLDGDRVKLGGKAVTVLRGSIDI